MEQFALDSPSRYQPHSPPELSIFASRETPTISGANYVLTYNAEIHMLHNQKGNSPQLDQLCAVLSSGVAKRPELVYVKAEIVEFKGVDAVRLSETQPQGGSSCTRFFQG